MYPQRNRNVLWTFFIASVCLQHCQILADDFESKCAPCKCVWSSGKRLGDCRDTRMIEIPKNLSSEMQVLDLSDNFIAEVRKTEFINNNLHNLHKIYMRNCTLMQLHRDSFKDLTILIELDLSHNMIRVLEPGLFDDLVKLRSVVLNNNEIDRLEDNLFVNLKHLAKVELKNNRLAHVGLSVFSNIPQRVALYFDGNNLGMLRKETFQSLELASLSLSANPWNCTCDLKPFRDFMIDRKLYTPPTACEYPQSLKGKLWTEVPTDSFACRPIIIRSALMDTHVDVSAENVSIRCKSKGYPKPNITWVFNKRAIDNYDPRVSFKEFIERDQREASELFTSELTIRNVKMSDRGAYTCMAQNKGGKDEAEIRLGVSTTPVVSDAPLRPAANDNMMLIAIIVAGVVVVVILIIILVLCCCCRNGKKYTKNGSISENGLVPLKMDKSQNESILEGSVVMELQKSLLTEVNPVEKPPRHPNGEMLYKDMRDGHELKRTLLDETRFGNHDDETQSIAFSDTAPRTRAAYVDDGYGGTLPPDLLSFSQRFPQSPSLQSSMSNIQDGRLYVKSPVSSPVYTNNPVIYQGQVIPTGYRTLQHPKTGRTIALAPARSNSPFTPAPLMYPPVMMKQGYVTIPRKQRLPSWTPSINSASIDYPPTSPTSTMSTEIVEPVYDNLGLRTTAAGNSALNINKLGQNLSMKDRPLPETPGAMGEAIVADAMSDNDQEPLYGGRTGTTPIITATGEKATKVPPRPPPKPKKRMSVASNGGGPNSTNQLFEDEGEDGTEV